MPSLPKTQLINYEHHEYHECQQPNTFGIFWPLTSIPLAQLMEMIVNPCQPQALGQSFWRHIRLSSWQIGSHPDRTKRTEQDPAKGCKSKGYQGYHAWNMTGSTVNSEPGCVFWCFAADLLIKLLHWQRHIFQFCEPQNSVVPGANPKVGVISVDRIDDWYDRGNDRLWLLWRATSLFQLVLGGLNQQTVNWNKLDWLLGWWIQSKWQSWTNVFSSW